MYAARIVPWANKSELDDLKKWFYSKDQRAKAVSRVKSYQSKGSQYLPHVIDSTSQITSAILLDETDNNVGMNAVRMAYTMALIRFVNGILDPSQQAQYAIPLHTLARNVGLSSSFVDLRHWGTHERELPSIGMLRITAKEALGWLWDNYWNSQELEDIISEEDMDSNDKVDVPLDENTTELNRLLLVWPGMIYDFSQNKPVWQNNNTSLISSTNFVVSEKKDKKSKSPEDKINNYINEWKVLWKQFPEKNDFVAVVMEKYNSLLLHVFILKLNDFSVHYFRWLLTEYSEQLKNKTQSNLKKNNFTKRKANPEVFNKHFQSFQDLASKLVKRVLNHINIKNVITHWDTWKEIIAEHPSYLASIVVGILLKKMDVTVNSNSDWRKKKKKKQAENDQTVIRSAVALYQELSESHGKDERDEYEQSFAIKRTETKADSPKMSTQSTNSIFDDLANLKKRQMQSTTDKEKPTEPRKVVIWKQAPNWTPKPFGVL